VLVTGAGGPAGTAVVEALHGAGHHVVAADADPGAVGLRLAPAAVVLPRADDPDYVDALLAACVRHGVTVLVATVAEELEALAGAAPRLAAAGVASWLPDPAAVRRCTDKWAFAKALAECGVAHPATGLGADPAVPGPWIVKPRSGRGSRHVTAVDDAADLERATRAVPEAITQARVEGREWTVDLLVAPDGSLAGASPRWRLETRGGISTAGETFEDPVVTATALAAMTAVGLTGVANVQGFTGDDGAVTVVEVNPRFSGGLPLTLAAGCDVVGEHLRVALGGTPRPARLVARPGVRMHRWFSAVFEEAAA
jgi:carbamoyl-phosphate synthase large subunit